MRVFIFCFDKPWDDWWLRTMGFRFWRRIGIAPGLSLNLSKLDGSLSFALREYDTSLIFDFLAIHLKYLSASCKEVSVCDNLYDVK